MSTYTWAELGSTWEQFGSSQWYYINESLAETVNVDLLSVTGSKGVSLALPVGTVSVTALASGAKTITGTADPVSASIQIAADGYMSASSAASESINVETSALAALSRSGVSSESLEIAPLADGYMSASAGLLVAPQVSVEAISATGYKTALYTLQFAVSVHIIDASGTALKPPINVQLEETDLGVVRVIWDAVSGAQHGYDVMRDGEVIARDIMVTEYVDESAPNGLIEYRVGTVVMEEAV